MFPDNGPPDGDFASYIEALTRSRGAGLTKTDPTSGLRNTDVTSTATPPNLASLRAEFVPLLRITVAILLLLGIAGAFGPPYSTMTRIAALVLAVYVIRRAMSRASEIRNAVRGSLDEARKKVDATRAAIERHKP